MEQEVEGKRYLIFGHYGGSNTGDEAMLWSLLGRLTRSGMSKIRVVVKGERRAIEFSHTESISASPLDLLRGVIWCDEFLIGGGTHFHDDYCRFRYIRHGAYMGRIVGFALLAKLLGKKFRMIGMGFGPFAGISARLATSIALRLADTVTTRDEASFKAAYRCRKNTDVGRSFDLAALLVPDQKRKAVERLVGISVAFSGSYSMMDGDSEEWWDYFAEQLIGAAKESPGVRFRIIVLRGGDREDDQILSKQLYDWLVEGLGEESVELCPYDSNPRVMLSVISECESMIATRYHAALMGYVSGCRLLLLCYHRKLGDLADEVRLPDEAKIEFRTRSEWANVGVKLRRFLDREENFRAGVSIEKTQKAAAGNFNWLQADEKSVEQTQVSWVLVSPKPPPRHGASRAVEVLLAGSTPGVEWRHVDARYSETIAELQKPSIRKLFLLCRYLVRTIRQSRGADGVLLTPSLQAGTFLKDSMFIWAVWLLGRKSIVAWYHMRFETMDYDGRNWLMRWFVRQTLCRVRWHVCVAPCLLEGLPEFLERASLVALPNGIPSIGPLKSFELESDGIIQILYVSNLGNDKGWRLLKDVADRMCSRFSNVRFDFYGASTPDISEGELVEVFCLSDFSNRIRYRGILEEKDKASVFGGADILAFPSFNEAFPITLLEALSVGLPIVSTNVGGIADSVRDGEGGFLVSPRDADEMEEKLGVLVQDSSLRERFGRFNHQHYQSQYTDGHYCERWAEFLSGPALHRSPVTDELVN